MTKDEAKIEVNGEELTLKRVKVSQADTLLDLALRLTEYFIQMCLLCLGGPVARCMHPPGKCKRLAALNSKRKEENLQPISISEDGEINWVNQAPTLDVQETLRTLMAEVASLKAEVKALKEAGVTTPSYAEATKSKDKPKEEKAKGDEQKAEGSGSKGKKSGRGRGTGRGGRKGGVTTD